MTSRWQGVLSGYLVGSSIFILRTIWGHLEGDYNFTGTFIMAILAGVGVGLYSYWKARQQSEEDSVSAGG